MRILWVCLIVSVLAGGVEAGVSVLVCESDEITPFDYRAISLETELTFLIQSDEVGAGWFSLALLGENIVKGELAARGPLVLGDWSGSHLPAAGSGAAVYTWEESDVFGFDMYTDNNPVPGDWFIIDYHPLAEGAVDIHFYDNNYSMDPIQTITIHQVPEPASLVLVCGGFLAVCRRRRLAA